MKPVVLISFMVGALLGCTADSHHVDVAQSILIDVTDSISISFPTANEIVAPMGLDEHPYQSVRLDIATISDRDVTTTETFGLENENALTNNILVRKEQIHGFISRIDQCLAAIKIHKARNHSIVYRQVARRVNDLAKIDAQIKRMIIYSDLYENDGQVNFYDPQIAARLKTHPEMIQKRLEDYAPLSDLHGIDFWLLYEPSSYKDNNTYMPIANFYKHLFEAHGATVHIDNKFSMP